MESDLLMKWQVEMLKQGIPDPSLVAQGPSGNDTTGDKNRNYSLQDEQIENFANAVFVHTKFVFNSQLLHKFLCYKALWGACY